MTIINEIISDKTNYIYTYFAWTASNCSPNRDGGTGEIRVDTRRRVFTTQECFNQIVKNGVFFAAHSGLTNASRAILMGCKNEHFGSRTLKGAGKELLKAIASAKNESNDNNLTKEDVFYYCFDVPIFGLVNSNGLEHQALPESITGSVGLIYLPKTVTQVKVENRGISNAYSQPISTTDDRPKDMPGSHYTDYLVEGVFGCFGFFNVKQLEFIAEKKFGMTDKSAVRTRIQELYNLYLMGIWEGFKLLGYTSTMRKGQQPLALYSAQRETLADYISDPADMLSDDKGELPTHETFVKTIADLHRKLPSWMSVFGDGGMRLVVRSDVWPK